MAMKQVWQSNTSHQRSQGQSHTVEGVEQGPHCKASKLQLANGDQRAVVRIAGQLICIDSQVHFFWHALKTGLFFSSAKVT